MALVQSPQSLLLRALRPMERQVLGGRAKKRQHAGINGIGLGQLALVAGKEAGAGAMGPVQA